MKKNYKLTEKELKIINKASNITITNYEVKNREIAIDNLINIIEDLLGEIEHKEEMIEEPKKIKKLPKEITDNVCATRDQKIIANKIDELIDEINNLKEKSNESSNNKSK